MLSKKFAVVVFTAVIAVTLSACRNSTETTTFTTEITYGEYRMPSVGLATLLPVPDSNKGEIIENTSTTFYLDVDRLTAEQFESYLEKCADAGFIFDHSKYHDTYYVFYSELYELTVFYNERDSLMSVIINKL